MASSRYWQQKIDVNYKNEICEVFELASQHHFEAFFVEVSREGPLHQAIFTYHLTAGDFTAEGKGPTKYDAKLQAAQQVLPELRRLPLPPEEERPNFWRKKKKNRTGLWQELPKFKPHQNPVACLEKLLTDLRGKPAEFTIVSVDKETNPHVFTMQLVAAEQTVEALGMSRTEAKKNAASKMLNIFGYDFLVSEPVPKPKKVLPEDRTAQEIEKVVPVVVIQKADSTPREEEPYLVPQDIPAQPEEEPLPEHSEMLPVEVPTAEEPAGQTQNEEDQAEPPLETPSNEHQQVLDVTDDPTSQTEEIQPKVNLQVLPPDVLSKLIFMGVIAENNGFLEWAEPKASTTCQEESDDVCSPLQTLPKEDQTGSVAAIGETNEGETSQTDLANVTNLTSAICETELVLHPEALFLTRSVVKKIFKMARSDDCRGRTLVIVRLRRKIGEHLILDGQRETREGDLEKIGKKAAKRLIVEYGSAGALLRALQEEDNAALEAAVVNNINNELRAFKNRPKSALQRIFSRVRRAFTC